MQFLKMEKKKHIRDVWFDSADRSNLAEQTTPAYLAIEENWSVGLHRGCPTWVLFKYS